MFDPHDITRPDRILLRYYALVSALLGPFFPFAFVPLYFKYHTLKYQFDESGVSMQWGILFRREIHLTYRRIQDIHLTRNLVQRWLGLASIAIQTASGSSGAEMTIEGILDAEALRDYLYQQMRGTKDDAAESQRSNAGAANSDQALQLLSEIRDLLRERREGPRTA